jgi:hypothetical protein
MVGHLIQIFACLLLAIQPGSFSVEIPPKLTVKVDPDTSMEDQEITAKISIIHELKQKVDVNSFTLDAKPLKVQFVEEVSPEPLTLFKANDPENLMVTTYSFKIPAKKKGLYVVGAVAANVGGLQVSSNPTTYEVIAPQIAPASELKLEASIKSTPPFYPGQKVVFEYRILFSQPIELTKEDLPLLNFEGFRTVGAPAINTIPLDKATQQTIDQTAIGLSPGTFRSKPSLIEGYVYRTDETGNQTRVGPLLQARADPVEIQVQAFPDKNKPDTFNGALGVFKWTAKLLNPGPVAAGEKLQLELTVTGKGDLDTVTLPGFSVQKGFKGVFRYNDIPAVGETSGLTKRFIVELTPLTPAIKEIPPLEFSSFDPTFSKYFTSKIPAISITVKAPSNTFFNPENNEATREAMSQAAEALGKTQLLEIEGNVALAPTKAEAEHLSVQLLLIFVPAVLLLVAGEILLYNWFKTRALRKRVETSRELILEALKSKNNPNVALPLIKRALLLRLYEIGATPEVALNPQSLSEEGIQGDIRRFLVSLEEKSFGGLNTDVEAKEILEEAAQLYYRLRPATK